MNPRTQMQPPSPSPSPSPSHHHFDCSVSSEASGSIGGTKAKAPHIDFPTSPPPPPQSADGSGSSIEEVTTIQHYSHPNHHLAQITVPADLFLCGGCREHGAGKRFTCQECDFQLHEFCALSPPVLRGHALHPQHQLVFHSRPKQAGITWPKCDVCGKSIKGFTFRCRACSFQMHPCCAMLSTEMIFPPQEMTPAGGHCHSLKLLPTATGSQLVVNNIGGGSNNAVSVCGECKKKRTGGRMYRCAACDYHLHALCAKAIINGLRASGMTAPEKPNKSSMLLGTAARLASQVVIEFIGGLIEGIGEGVGQSLFSGRRLRRRTRPT